jgi:DNA-binding SARP family transcriptional activator/Cdc6-like AAA superfamily ATPase
VVPVDRAGTNERQLEFLILGPFEVHSEGRVLELRSAKQRSLLANLLLSANEVVSSDRLIEELWPGGAPEKASNVLQVHVSQLRKVLTGGVLVTRSPGYVLAVDPEHVDAVRFEQLVNEGIAALAMKEPGLALQTLERALGLWRGSALSDFAFEEFARTEAARLEELRLLATEERVDAALALGRHAALVGELEGIVAANPLRERPAGQLMLALYRSRRQAEALEAYTRTRHRLVDELGIDPSPELQRLERAILNQDPSLDLPEPASEPAAAAPPAHEPRPPAKQVSRKTVTVLFADFALTPARGDTIEPETLEPVFSYLGDELAKVVERHGGSIHWSSEIEIVAVFGLPRVHEDDALRAVRASIELREAIGALSPRLEGDFGVRVDVRVGVNTGQVVAGVAFASPAMGGASSVAARLGRAAPVGEILIADATKELVRDAVTVETADAGWRLVDVFAGALGVERRLESPTVGREAELATLRRAYETVARERAPSLVSILGPAGIGKSHLARAFFDPVEGEARVLVGRTAAYGEGSTFAPLVEIVRRLGGDAPVETIRGIVAADPDRDVIVERVAAAIGLSESGGQTETTFWAVRKLFEALARERPLVVVLDDLHWAEPTFLDLVEHIVDWAFDSPILLLGLSRPELLEERPSLTAAGRNVSSLLLKPLGDAESEALIDNLLDGAALDTERRARIADAAGGNPFFLEQMVAMHTVEGVSPTAIPPTIQAVLAARLDRLEPVQLSLLERASVMGKEFWPTALTELVDEQPSAALNTALRELVRKQLVEPTRSTIPVGDALRFHSGLIRDAVYESVPKRVRAALHERVASWLARAIRDPVVGQYEEVLGHHLEQAYRYLDELGPLDDHAVAVGQAGADHLGAAGRRAFARGDMAVASGLLVRAAALLPTEGPGRLALLPTIGEALSETGDFKRAVDVLGEAIEAGDSKARVVRALVQASSGAGSTDAIVREAEAAIAVSEPLRDDAGLATAYRMLAWAHGTEGRYGDAAEAARRAIDYADRAGDTRQHLRASTLYALSALHGPTPATEAIERCRQIVEDVAGDRRAEGLVTIILGWLEAMRGDFETAREHARRGRSILDDLGTNVLAASTVSSEIEMLAGDPAAAERDLRRDYDALTELGETYLRSTVAGDLADAVYAQGRVDEALALAAVGEELAAEDDVISQVFWRSVRAKVLAQDGDEEHALPLAERAVALIRGTDSPVALARTLVDLAEVQGLADRPEEAREALREAAALLERKGNVVAAQRAEERLEALGGERVDYIM